MLHTIWIDGNEVKVHGVHHSQKLAHLEKSQRHHPEKEEEQKETKEEAEDAGEKAEPKKGEQAERIKEKKEERKYETATATEQKHTPTRPARITARWYT